MIATIPHTETDVGVAVAAALREIVSTRSWGGACFASLPLFYPSGAAVTIKVEAAAGGFRVSDAGMAYREIEMIGAERYFAANAKAVAEEIAVFAERRSLVVSVSFEELAGTMADIANASAKLAHKIVAKVGAKGEAEIADHLYQRLVVVFGADRVDSQFKIVGPSAKEWEADVRVKMDGRDAIFQAVPNHHSAIYSTSTMFHDLALLDRPPATISVVRDKVALGPFFAILAQAGHVVEDRQADTVFEMAASWQG